MPLTHRLSIAQLPQDFGELTADLVEAAVELLIQGVDLLIDLFNQLVDRVDVGALLATARTLGSSTWATTS